MLHKEMGETGWTSCASLCVKGVSRCGQSIEKVTTKAVCETEKVNATKIAEKAGAIQGEG